MVGEGNRKRTTQRILSAGEVLAFWSLSFCSLVSNTHNRRGADRPLLSQNFARFQHRAPFLRRDLLQPARSGRPQGGGLQADAFDWEGPRPELREKGFVRNCLRGGGRADEPAARLDLAKSQAPRWMANSWRRVLSTQQRTRITPSESS